MIALYRSYRSTLVLPGGGLFSRSWTSGYRGARWRLEMWITNYPQKVLVELIAFCCLFALLGIPSPKAIFNRPPEPQIGVRHDPPGPGYADDFRLQVVK